MAGLHHIAVTGISNNFLTPNAIVLFREVEFVYEFLFQERSVSGIVDLHFAHHLTNDNLKVFVIDFHTLQTIDVLYLVDNVFLHSRWTFNGKDITRSDDAIRQRRTRTNGIVLLNQNLFGQADKVFLLITCLRCDHNLTVTAFHLTHCYLAVDLGNNGRIRRIASLEKLSNTRKTTRNIAGTTHSTRYLDQSLTGLDGCSVIDNNVTAYGEVVSSDDFTL